MSTREAKGKQGASDRKIEITSAERLDGRELVVEFSDGTYAQFTAEQLLAIVPARKKDDEGFAGE